MLRKWCIPVATLALVGGSMLAATGTAAASTAAHGSGRVTMQPGGLARHLVGPLRARGRGSQLGDQLELVRLCGHGWHGRIQQRLGQLGGAHGALHLG